MKSRILAQMIARGARFDANETAFLDQQLTFIEARTVDVIYSRLKAREFIPMEFSLPEWAETWTHRSWDKVGMAALISSYSKDLPRVDVQITETEHKTLRYGAAFGYNIDELRASARLERPIDAMRSDAARQACDLFLDEVASIGVSSKNIVGFLNDTNVPDGDVTTGNWLGGATPDQILGDMFEMEDQVITQSDENHMPTDIILPPAHYGHIATTPRSSTSDTTILAYFLAHSQSVKTVSRWRRLNDADSGNPMAVCYEKNPQIVKFPIAVEFEMLEPEKHNLEWVVNCIAKCGGTTVYRPLGMYYGTDIGAIS